MSLSKLFLDNIDPALAALLGKSEAQVWKAIDARVPSGGPRGVIVSASKKLRGVPAKTTLGYSTNFDEKRRVHSIGLNLGMTTPMVDGVAPAAFVDALHDMLTKLRGRVDAEHGPVVVEKTTYRVPKNLATAVPILLPSLKEQWRFSGGRFTHQAWGEATLVYEAHFTWSNRP